ncbi:MAG: energy transducer TonB [Burkholderiaceae bacterium]
MTTCVLAQQAPAPAGTDQDANAPSERAKRQADNPFRWIMIQDDKPRPKKDEPKERRAPAAAPAAAREAAPAAAPAVAAPVPRSFEPRTPAAAVAAPAPAQNAAPIQNPPAPAEPALAAAAPAKIQPEPEPEEPLRVLAQAQPELTRQIITANIDKGSVRVKYTVNPDGSVGDAEIVSTTNRVLNSSVLAALKQWKYAPIKAARETQVEFAFDFSR